MRWYAYLHFVWMKSFELNVTYIDTFFAFPLNKYINLTKCESMSRTVSSWAWVGNLILKRLSEPWRVDGVGLISSALASLLSISFCAVRNRCLEQITIKLKLEKSMFRKKHRAIYQKIKTSGVPVNNASNLQWYSQRCEYNTIVSKCYNCFFQLLQMFGIGIRIFIAGDETKIMILLIRFVYHNYTG